MRKFYWRIQRWFRRKTKRCTACGKKHNGVHFGMSKERFIREFTR